MNGDVHVRFWTRGVRLVTVPRLVTLSHPGAEKGSKGLAVRVRRVLV